MNRLVEFTIENVNALIGALELGDLRMLATDNALEGTMQMGPNGPTSLLANCYATKSALCGGIPHIDDGEPIVRD